MKVRGIKMDFSNESTCRRRSCHGTRTIPTHIITTAKGHTWYYHRCPKCHKLYKILVPSYDIPILVKFAAQYFNHCDACGFDNSDNWEKGRTNYSYPDRDRTVFNCKMCGKHRTKIATDRIMTELEKYFKKTKPELTLASPKQVNCKNCGTMIEESSRFCDNCGAKLNAF